MAMQFWQAQRRARLLTLLYLSIFVVLTVGVAALLDFAVRMLAAEGEVPPLPYLGVGFLAVTFLVAGGYYLSYVAEGGAFVARALGARKIEPTTADAHEKMLHNVVEEMAVASGQPVPEIFILDTPALNAFAAGTTPKKAAITVTRGALRQLTRDELQGVVAHEFGHIYNGDMKISMRLAAMIMGFVFVLYLGIRLMEGSLFVGGGRGRREGGGGGNTLGLIALLLLVAGALTWFLGAVLRACVSRQREYLADACAVQFTRNPEGITSALRKLATLDASGTPQPMPKKGMAYAHLYFNSTSLWARIFATHPPLEKRIAALTGSKNSKPL